MKIIKLRRWLSDIVCQNCLYRKCSLVAFFIIQIPRFLTQRAPYTDGKESNSSLLDHPIAKNLLLIRILFHYVFALMYLPRIVLAFMLNVKEGLESLRALGYLVVFVAL